MEKRRLGRTGYLSSIILFGAASLWEIKDQQEANELLDLAFNRGINHIDVAPLYGYAEERLGTWLPSRREDFFISSKTLKRSREEAWSEINSSLEKLHLDRFDLYQLHSVSKLEELDRVLGSNGAIHALVRAKNEGLINHIGVTGHGILTPMIQLEALKRFPFETVMFPLNPNLYSIPEYKKAAETLLLVSEENDIGVIITKAIAKGPWEQQDKKHIPWYQPFEDQNRISQGIHFALSQRCVTSIASVGDPHLFSKSILAAETFSPIDLSTQKSLIKEWSMLESIF